MRKPQAIFGALAALAFTLVTPTGAGAQPHTPEQGYVDDRSSAESVVYSYVDAINRKELVRAYSYWAPATPDELPPFEDFQQGYADTASVELTLGTVLSGVGAGQLYYSVPVTLLATQVDGSTQTFVGCYTLHISRPRLQAVPPFHPLAIQRARVAQIDPDADTATLMAQSCEQV